MKTASIQELKQELHSVAPAKLLELCLRLARFKKENKELLTYLLFEAHDEDGYISSVKMEIDEGFVELPKSNVYLTKKSLRKTLRTTNKYIRYTGSKQVEVSLLLYFCKQMKERGILEKRGLGIFKKTSVLENIYEAQLKKIGSALAQLHPDLQYDHQRELDSL